MEIQELFLNAESLCRGASQRGFSVAKAEIKNKYGTDQKMFAVTVLSNDASRQLIKLPYDERKNSEFIRRLEEKKSSSQEMRVRFTNLKVQPYVIFSERKSGVSCSADDLEELTEDILSDITESKVRKDR